MLPVQCICCFGLETSRTLRPQKLLVSPIFSKSKLAASAKKHSKSVQEILGHVNESLSKLAARHVPTTSTAAAAAAVSSSSALTTNGKRKSVANSSNHSSATPTHGSAKKKTKTIHTNKNSDLAEREDRALVQLADFIVQRGGSPSAVGGFQARVTRKGGSGSKRFDVNFFNADGRRFRSMLEVGRFLNIVHDGGTNRAVGGGGGGMRVAVQRRQGFVGSREQEAEKKRIRKELEKLRKAHQRATKAMDDFATTNNEARYPMDDRLLMEEEQQAETNGHGNHHSAMSTFAAARIPEVTGFPGIPDCGTPEVLMTWDFLCTFERALALTPIALDDFASALVYKPPEGQLGDDVLVPPVYLSEAHLGLLKLLFQDRSSDDWWWSTLETEETEGIKISQLDEAVEKEDVDRPVIKLNFAAALDEVEDPLMTASWLSSLDKICGGKVDKTAVKEAIRTALNVVSNKWVAAYLRKCLEICKVSGAALAQKAIRWLVGRVREARPDIAEKTSRSVVLKARSKVIEEVTKQMEELGGTAPTVTADDANMDVVEDDEDSDDESDDEDDAENVGEKVSEDNSDEAEKPASALPPKPIPAMVDMLLPPAKPLPNSEFVDSFTWPHLAGASVARVLHRKKRLLNEMDDSIRESQALPRLLVNERREREKLAASRTLTECVESLDYPSPVEKAADHLAAGGNYLDLTPLERLCILRLLIEAAYDTDRVQDVVSGNYKQRTSAMKALEVESRRAKREAKEKAAADEAAAREQLAAEARERFLDETREEIRQLNAKSNEFSDEVIESLTDEDIIDFDDDIKADYEALPTPESFTKAEVSKMVVRMQEEAAFDTDILRVFSLEELVEKEQRELEEMEGQFAGFGGEQSLLDDSLDRETLRSIERIQRDIEKARTSAETLPAIRRKALDQLQDAMDDGTIKVLRTAYNAAKKAKLVGTDDETGGIWTVDLVRDAALELEKAKQNKRVLDAQKDLVAKRNKCFIRTDPIGRDRVGNRFWVLSNRDENDGENDHIWIESEFSLKDDSKPMVKPPPGFLDLSRDPKSVSFGASDIEQDFMAHVEDKDRFRIFSRKEYHSTGFSPTLARYFWGSHVSEESLRRVIKNLDSSGIRENELKTHLKEKLEQSMGGGEKQEALDDRDINAVSDEQDETEAKGIRTEGDKAYFLKARDTAKKREDVDAESLESLCTGIGADVRVRQVLDSSKDPQVARYENGTVSGWKLRNDHGEVLRKKKSDDEMSVDGEEDAQERKSETVEAPMWKVSSERGHTWWLTGEELIESVLRYKKWAQGRGYFEHDSAFFSYRNALGRHCGRAADAAYSSSPYFFAKLMIKREAELYPRLKLRSYDNSWGGQSGARAMWTNSMKDYAYDFATVKQGLVTLENALFDLTGQFAEYENPEAPPSDMEAFLKHSAMVFDIELESLEKSVIGLWNSPSSRAVYLYIVEQSTTTGFLALALDLLYRNAVQYLVNHNLLGDSRNGGVSATGASASADWSERGSYTTSSGRTTRTRRMNTWQQQQQQQDDFWSLPY